MRGQGGRSLKLDIQLVKIRRHLCVSVRMCGYYCVYLTPGIRFEFLLFFGLLSILQSKAITGKSFKHFKVRLVLSMLGVDVVEETLAGTQYF